MNGLIVIAIGVGIVAASGNAALVSTSIAERRVGMKSSRRYRLPATGSAGAVPWRW